jgi:uncharacterized SAM-binding protein YcdF (DUF218 family)
MMKTTLSKQPATSISRLQDALARGLALFLGGFALFNLGGSVRSATFDANLWWSDLRALPPMVANGFILLSALCLIAFGVRPPRSLWRVLLTLGCVSLLGLVAVANAAQFFSLLARGAVRSGLPLPLSLFVATALGLILVVTARPGLAWRGPAGVQPILAVCAGCAIAFPLLQMFCFGKTDYRRPAEVAVVLGARTYADGRPSDALADRVRTACRLYRDGWAGKLLFSGGPGDGALTEPEAMKRLAIQLGVKPEDILVDEAGLNTQATVRNTEALFERLHASRILVVSHFYHLPRLKLAYQRAGREVYTVPAKESYWLRQMPYNMLREVAALWVYYLRPLGAPPAAGQA